MMIIQQVYIVSLVAFTTLLLFLGSYLIFGACPDELKKSSYSWSRKVTGLAFVWLALEIIAFAVFDIRADNVALSSMLNLITYYLFALFVSSAFIRLLDEEATLSRSKIALELGLWYIYSLLLIFFVLRAEERSVRIALIVGAILMFAKALDMFLCARKVYNNAIERSLNYHSENIEPIIRWIKISAFLLLTLCITSLITAFLCKLFVVINVLFAICVIAYICVNYINVMVRFTIIKERNGSADEVGLIPHDDSCDGVLKPEVLQAIKIEVDRWIDSRGYVEPEVSIKSLSAVARTNRTYLSQYINRAYRLPFRDWVISLRVSYAKHIMMEQPKLTVVVVAQMVGFSSSATFTRAFTRQESISPVKWREQNLELCKDKGFLPPPPIVDNSL